jgi:hypothetical protein
MAKSVLHVVPHEDAWAVKREGNERASSTHPTQKDAIEAARDLAKELDDIVIHRADGTIRERVTYYGTNGEARSEERTETTTATAARTETREGREVRLEDMAGVGSRVSWAAVLAGAAVAIAAYVTLSLFALALGLSISDQTWGRNFTLSAVAVSGLILILSLLLGGFVASSATAGEQPREAGMYGVLVWGAVFAFLLTGGLGFGVGHLSGLRQVNTANASAGSANASLSPNRVTQELGLTEQQKQHYAELHQSANAPPADFNPSRAAWWAFGFVALSLLASIVGGWLGGGPEWVLRRETDTRATVPAPRPA